MPYDIIFIRDLRTFGILGVHECERMAPREILVNVRLFTTTRCTDMPDDLSVCVDYSQVSQKIRALVEGAARFTVEALAEDIAHLCLSQARVRKVTVRVEKPRAVEETESVGVEIERKN